MTSYLKPSKIPILRSRRVIRAVAPATTAIVPVLMSTNKRSKKRRTQPSSSTRNSLIPAYMATLNDPFDCPPVKLGFGTTSSTVLASGVYHNIFIATNGNLQIIFAPNCSQMLYVAAPASTGAGPSYLGYNPSNLSTITSQGSSGRVISGGVRVLPLVKSTDALGIITGLTPQGQSLSAFTSLTIDQLVSYPSTHLFGASAGITGHTYPNTDRAVDFLTETLTGGSTAVHPSNLVIITISGLAAGTGVLLEAILNVEILPSGNNFTGLVLAGESDWTPRVSSVYPTPGELYRALIPRLDPILDPNFLEKFRRGIRSANRASSASGFRSQGPIVGDHTTMTSLGRDIERNSEKQANPGTAPYDPAREAFASDHFLREDVRNWRPPPPAPTPPVSRQSSGSSAMETIRESVSRSVLNTATQMLTSSIPSLVEAAFAA